MSDTKEFFAPKIQEQKDLWEKFLQDKVGLTVQESKKKSVIADKNWEPHWIKYRDDHFSEEAEALASQLGSKMTSTGEDEKHQKAMKKLAREPGNFDGSHHKF